MYSELRQYLVKLLGPEIDAKLTLIYTETQAMVNALAEDVNASKDAWQGLFDEFMANVIVELEGLNDQAVANLVNDAGSNIRVALDSLYATREMLPCCAAKWRADCQPSHLTSTMRRRPRSQQLKVGDCLSLS